MSLSSAQPVNRRIITGQDVNLNSTTGASPEIRGGEANMTNHPNRAKTVSQERKDLMAQYDLDWKSLRDWYNSTPTPASDADMRKYDAKAFELRSEFDRKSAELRRRGL